MHDRGTQYRSGFYYLDEEQKALIESSKAAYEKALGKKKGTFRMRRLQTYSANSSPGVSFGRC